MAAVGPGSFRRRGLLAFPPQPAGTAGDPGLFGPESVVWTVARERVLLAGGPAALLMQIAHPLVAAGVADHSDFRRDPFERLRATLGPTLTISFGDREQAHAAAAAVGATHREVRGRLSGPVGPFAGGTAYDAADPRLALWVHATLVSTALDAYSLLVRPLGRVERARYHDEAKPFAGLFGVPPEAVPATYDDFETYVRSMVEGSQLVVDGRTRGLARYVLAPPLPTWLTPATVPTRVITAGLLPGLLRSAFGLPWRGSDRAAFRAAGGASRRTVPLLPARIRYWPHYLVALERIRA